MVYRDWLKDYCDKYRVDILAYCSITNHVHLVAIPEAEEGLQRVLKPLHMRYAQRVNRLRGWKGRVWQGRFFSSPLYDSYLWATIRYVERNPEGANGGEGGRLSRWSGAAAHCGLTDDRLLSQRMEWWKQRRQIIDWSSWLAECDEPQSLEVLRRNVEMGLPCGTENIIRRLEKIAGRLLQFRSIGRPGKKKA